MAFFNFDNNMTTTNSFYNDNNNVECITCANNIVKLFRCSCCNEIINLNDLLNHINKNSTDNKIKIVKLVKYGNKPSIRIAVKNLYHITKFLKDNNSTALALNFSYKTNYMDGLTSDTGHSIKTIQNIEYDTTLPNFKPDNIEIRYLVMCANIPPTADVLISIHDLNVLIPQL